MMANCFFCGKKIGMFDGCSYIEKMPTCSSCDSMIREDVNNVLATCRTKDDIIKTKELILKKLESKFSEDKLTVLNKYVVDMSNLYYSTLQNKEEKIKNNSNSANSIFQAEFDSHMLTTGYEFHGYEIKDYVGLVSGECVIGTGIMADLFSDFSDLTGSKSSAFSNKMKEVKQAALNEMIEDSIELGGNAIIGIQYDHITFSGKNMIGISINGTSVKIVKVEKE